MSRAQKTKLIRFCTVCGAILLIAILCWSMVWRIDTIQSALVGMEAIEDDYLRRVEYGWVGNAMFLSSLAAAGVSAILFLILEESLLGPRPIRKEERTAQKLSYGKAFLALLLVAILIPVPGGLFWDIYICPWINFGFAAAFLVWRIRSRIDYFPPSVDDSALNVEGKSKKEQL